MTQELNSKKIFFIIAPDRSGTSLCQELMNTFSGFCNTEESRIAGPGSPSCWDFVDKHNDFSYLENFIRKNWTSEYFVEKSPPSIRCLPQIKKRFSDANFIFLTRHPLKIILSQLNLFQGVSEIGTRKNDLGSLVLGRANSIISIERMMAKRLLKMISNQISYKKYFPNKVELRYEDITQSLDSQLDLLEKKFGIKADRKEAAQRLKMPSYSSTFRYGLKELTDKMADNIIKFASHLWHYD